MTLWMTSFFQKNQKLARTTCLVMFLRILWMPSLKKRMRFCRRIGLMTWNLKTYGNNCSNLKVLKNFDFDKAALSYFICFVFYLNRIISNSFFRIHFGDCPFGNE